MMSSTNDQTIRLGTTDTAGSLSLWLIVLTSIALGLRLIRIDSGLWLDEIYSLVNQFRLSFPELIVTYVGDNQHPLYAVLASLSRTIFGEHAWSIRLPAVLFGVASVPALYMLGRELGSRRESFLAAMLLTFSYHHVWFSQNARGYTILAFATILATYHFLHLMRRPSTRDVWAYGLIAAAGCYAHLTMVFVVIGHFIVYMLALCLPRTTAISHRNWKPALAAFMISGVATLLLYAPMIGQVIDYFVDKPSKLVGVSAPTWALKEAIESLSIGFGTGIIVLAGVLMILVGIVSHLRRTPAFAGAFLAPVLVTIVGALLARGTMYPRFFFALVGLGILVGVRGVMVSVGGAAKFAFRGREAISLNLATAAMVVGILISALSLIRNYQYPKMDFQGTRDWIEARVLPGDSIVTAGGATTWPYRNYYATNWSEVRNAAELEAQFTGNNAVWVVYAFERYLVNSAPEIMVAIEERCVDEERFRGTLGGGDIFVCRMTYD